MEKNSLINELKKRIDDTRFSDAFKGLICNSHLISKMPIDLLNNLIFTNDYDFNTYLSFLFKFSKVKKGFRDYEDKLINLSNILLLNIGTINASELMNLLIETDLILNPNINEFVFDFLNIKETKKIDTLADILYSLDYKIQNIKISQIVELVRKINDSETLFLLKHFFSKKLIINDKNFDSYINLMVKNANNYNLRFFMRLLYIKEVRELPNIQLLLSKYILNENNSKVNLNNLDARNELLLEIFKNIDMLESRYLEKVLDFVNSCDEEKYNVIRKLIREKYLLKDRIFYILLTSLETLKNDVANDFILSILNNPRILNNELQVKAFLEFLKKTQDEKKLITFYKIFIVGNLKNESLYSDFSMMIQNAILTCKTKEQLETLNKLIPIIKTSKLQRDIIKIILNTNNVYALDRFPMILGIPYANDVKILEVMKKLNNLQNEIQSSLILNLISNQKIYKNNIFIYMVDEVLRRKNIKMLYTIEFISNFTSRYEKLLQNADYQRSFLRLFSNVLDINKPYKFDFLIKIINYQGIFSNKDQVDVINELIENVQEEFKYKILREYIRENIRKEDFSLNSKRTQTIIMLIKSCKHDYQTKTLFEVSKLVKDTPYEADLLVKSVYIENIEKGKKLIKFLEEKEILNNPKFSSILYHFMQSENKMVIDGMLELIKIPSIRESDFYEGYFMIMKRCKTDKQIQTLLKVLKEYPDGLDYELFVLSKKIMTTEDSIGLTLIGETIIASKDLGFDLADLLIQKINLYTDSDYYEDNDENTREIITYVQGILKKHTLKDNLVIQNLLNRFNQKNKVYKKK